MVGFLESRALLQVLQLLQGCRDWRAIGVPSLAIRNFQKFQKMS